MAAFSIIVPVYNTENYIAECLNSVLNQTCGDFECLIVDDGSRDGSISIAEKLISDDGRFRIIRQENSGPSIARNTGIRAAQGRWLVFLDSDDFLYPNALRFLSDTLAATGKTPDVIISSTYAYEKDHSAIMKDLSSLKRACEENLLKAVFRHSNFVSAPWQVTIRMDYLLENNLWFEPGLLHEDELWIPQVLGLSEHTVINNCAFYYNRCERSGSITNSKNIKKLTDKFYVIQKLKDVFQADERLHKYQDLIGYRRAQIFLSVVCNSGDYNDAQLNAEIRRNSGVLLESKSPKYFAVWLALKILGLRRVSALVRKIVS